MEALVERLLARVRELESVVVEQRRVIAEQADRIDMRLTKCTRWGCNAQPPAGGHG